MKDSRKYARKMKKLLAGAVDKTDAGQAPDRIGLLVRAVFEEDVTIRQAEKTMAILAEEFVDLNELRVSPIRDIVESVSRDHPGIRARAHRVTQALNRVFDQANCLSLDYLAEKPKREVRKILREDVGLSLYAESVVTLFGFGGHAIPVDQLLLEALKLGKHINPDSDEPDLQGFLERITPAKDDRAVHAALREYADSMATRVGRELARRERIARARAEAEAKAEAKAKAEAEAKAKRKRAARRAKSAKAKPKARKKKAKPPARKPGKTPRKTDAKVLRKK